MPGKVLEAECSCECVRPRHGSPEACSLVDGPGSEQVNAYMRCIQVILRGMKKRKYYNRVLRQDWTAHSEKA